MNDLEDFVNQVLNDLGSDKKLKLSNGEADFEKVANVLWTLNQFLYVTTDELEGPYLSAFHRFWKKNHERLLDVRVDEGKCESVAETLEHWYANCGDKLRPSVSGAKSLSPHLIANARFFTAVQDFTIKLRKSPYEIASRCPELFDARRIVEDEAVVDSLLRELGAESQYDKRRKYAKLCGMLLLERFDGKALNIAEELDRDAVRIRDMLINPEKRYNGLGFSEKKANMLIRDLYDLGVWTKLTDLEKLNVSSDANTMRIALRLGIVRTRIPLITSYLDVYGLQYEVVDRTVSQAWRQTWNIWGGIPENHRVAAPAFFDYFIYRIGQICCRPNRRACEIPCRGSRLQKLRELIPITDGYCPFRGLEDESTKMLNSPRAISIYGRTGWERGRTNMGGGGGISS
ncbi:MAG: hypothetical protein ABSF00_12780 [Candidatus Bathyarchaeia archaeon]